jgi:hypothetical protein
VGEDASQNPHPVRQPVPKEKSNPVIQTAPAGSLHV